MTMKDLNRRDLLKASGLATVASTGVALAAQRSGAGRRQREPRDIYELRRYTMEARPKVEIMKAFLSNAAIPAMNRVGIKQVGIFDEPPKKHTKALSRPSCTIPISAGVGFYAVYIDLADQACSYPERKRAQGLDAWPPATF